MRFIKIFLSKSINKNEKITISKQGINPAKDVFWLTKNLKSCRKTGQKKKSWITD